MTLLQALFLGFIQGLTEFLPVSSSGHLVIAQTFLGLKDPPVLFDVLVHVGSLIAIFVFFKNKLVNFDLKLIKLTLIGTIPAVIVGLILEPFLQELFSSLWIVAIGLLVTSFLLLTTLVLKDSKLNPKKLTIKNSLVIGFFQALAIIPGISRSGSTVVAGLQQGLKKQDAFYFSFLLAIPAITGAFLLQLKDISTVNSIELLPFLIGFVASAITSFFSIKLLEIVIAKTKLHYFSAYTFLLSIAVIFSILT